VSETHSKWYELAEKSLDLGDKIQKSYPGKLDGEFGHILMSDRKLVFVHEEGFLRKNYELTLDLPYDKIVEISQKGKHELDFTDVKDKKYVFETSDISISHVEDSLKELAHR